ncbi:hypothetical protein Vspart_01147 [Vibrio spartinae]|uniref:Uncharacterized protein n=1 Tax=Vibrio spartinae TaxID=1918945 RepID=A0A1N6M6V6_9VIBR|nr:hypothetical protein Vspart_01147 [Vibrio spartinae]SIO95165.1 hypothetical protein VSP9026_02904 [Vibrio spartinae]
MHLTKNGVLIFTSSLVTRKLVTRKLKAWQRWKYND